MDNALWISEKDVTKLLDLPTAIEALRAALPEETTGHGATMVKTHVAWDHSTLHAVGGTLPHLGLAGTKTWTHTPGGACPLLLLFDSASGALRAVIEAFALGQLRTAAISGLATDILAGTQAETFAIAGTGKQALAQVAAAVSVRPVRQVRVWSPTLAHAVAFAQRVTQSLGVDAVASTTAAEAIEAADIITLATRATEPFVDTAMPRHGGHINAIGAITPERAEFFPALLDRADVVVTDNVDQARALSQEFRSYYGDDDNHAWAAVKPLSGVVASDVRRPEGADLTVFKAMGIGLADVALGAKVFVDAQRVGAWQPVPQPIRATPRFLPIATSTERQVR